MEAVRRVAQVSPMATWVGAMPYPSNAPRVVQGPLDGPARSQAFSRSKKEGGGKRRSREEQERKEGEKGRSGEKDPLDTQAVP